MGDCVSSTTDSKPLRKSGAAVYNPYETKVTEEDYDFLRLPDSAIHDEISIEKYHKENNKANEGK